MSRVTTPAGLRAALGTLLAAALVALSLAGAPAAGAAPPAKYSLNVWVDSFDKANLEESGYPDRCKTWTQGRSSLAFAMRSARPVALGLIRSPVNDSTWGLIPRSIEPATDVYRYWRYRFHLSPSTSECSPCGPSSEYGQCGGETPDEVASDTCGGDGEERRGIIALTVSDAGIMVSASPFADFSDCRAPRRKVIPIGVSDPKIDRFLLPQGTRQLKRMKPGQRRTIRRTIRRGDCDRLRGRGLRTCSERRVVIKATRIS